jgi:hypothetical protein
MYDRLGLGVELDFKDSMTRKVNPLIMELDRLKRASKDATRDMQYQNEMLYRSMGRTYGNYKMFKDFNKAMKPTDQALLAITERFIRATSAATNFATAVNRAQAMGNFNRMANDMMRAQRMMGMMGYGQSRQQKEMFDTQAYTMLNYRLKDLNDRIALTKKGIQEMMNSPDASKFTKEIALARNALKQYEDQMASINAKQKMAEVNGYSIHKFMGKDAFVKMPDTTGQIIKNKLLGQSMMDVAYASGFVYKSLDKTGKMMTGMGYTTMEARMKLTQLTTGLQMAGLAMTQFGTTGIALVTAGLTALILKWEEAANLMHARSLIDPSMWQQSGWDLRDIAVDSGATQTEVAQSMASSHLIFQAKGYDAVVENAEKATFMQKIWGVSSEKSLRDVNRIMSKFGVDSEKAWDMYVAGAMKAKEESGKGFTGMMGIDRVSDLIDKDPERFKKLTSSAGDLAGAYERMVNAYEKGLGDNLVEWIGEMGSALIATFEPAIEPISRFFGYLKEGTIAVKDYMREHQELGRIISLSALAIGGFLAAFGPIILISSFMVRFRNILEGVSAGIFGLSKGGLAVLHPQALMAKQRMEAMTVAFARFPQTLVSIIPLLYSFIRMIPQFIFNVLRINPLLAVIGAGFVAFHKNLFGFRDLVMDFKDRAIEFGKGFKDGFMEAWKIGVKFTKEVLEKFREHFEFLAPVIDKFSDKIKKLFDKDTTQNWSKMGEVVGKIVAGFLAFKTLQFIATPFIEAGKKVGGLLAQLKLLPKSKTVRVNYIQSNSGSAGVPGSGGTPGVVGSVPMGATRSNPAGAPPIVAGMPMGGGGSRTNPNSRTGRRRAGAYRQPGRISQALSTAGGFFSTGWGNFRQGTQGQRTSRARANQPRSNQLGQSLYNLTGGGFFGGGRGGGGAGGASGATRAGRNAGTGFMRGFANVFKGGGSILKGIGGLFRNLGGPMLRGGAKIGGTLIKGLGKVALKGIPLLFKTAFRLIPILGWVLFAWDIIRTIFTNWEPIKRAAKKAWNWIKTDGVEMAKKVGKAVVKFLGDALDWTLKTSKKVWKWMRTDGVEMSKAVNKWIIEKLGDAFDWSKKKAKELWDKFLIWTMIKVGEARQALIDKMNNAKNTAITFFKVMWRMFLDYAREKVTTAKNTAINLLLALKNGAIEFFSSMWQRFLTYATEKASSAKTAVIGFIIGLKDSAISYFSQLWQQFLSYATTKAQEAKEGVINKMYEMKTSAVTALSNFFQPLIDAYNSAKNYITNNPIVQTVKKVTESVGGVTSGVGNFVGRMFGKKNARGGIFNSPQHGVLGEAGPEALIPLSSNMRGIANVLFKKTADALGYAVTGKKKAGYNGYTTPMSDQKIAEYSAYANGGIINRPHFGLVGEDGEEAIIPLTKKARGIDLWRQAGKRLGVMNSEKSSQSIAPKPQTAPARSKSNRSAPTSQDNSITIEKLVLQFTKEESGMDEVSARKQAQRIMKEFKKLVQEGRMRQGDRNLTLEDIVLGN